MIRNLRLLDDVLMQEVGGGRPLWSVANVQFGHKEGWPLEMRLQRDGVALEMVFQKVVSFRAHDESEIIQHWIRREEEGVEVGTIYEIGASTYLEELADGTASMMGFSCRHFLVAGYDLCVEVIADASPTIRHVG